MKILFTSDEIPYSKKSDCEVCVDKDKMNVWLKGSLLLVVDKNKIVHLYDNYEELYIVDFLALEKIIFKLKNDGNTYRYGSILEKVVDELKEKFIPCCTHYNEYKKEFLKM